MFKLILKNCSLVERIKLKYYFKSCSCFFDKRTRVLKSKRDKLSRFLKKLDNLAHENSFFALKIILSLLYREKLYKFESEIADILIKKQNEYYLKDEKTYEEKIEFAIELFKNWPDEISSQLRGTFTYPLEKLFVYESRSNPKYILRQFDSLDKNINRKYIFKPYEQRPLGLLEFSRNLKEYRPQLFLNALITFLDEYNMQRVYRGEFDEIKIKEITLEVYIIITSDKYQKYYDLEEVLQKLIIYSYMDEQWYIYLCKMIYELEINKKEHDKQSLKNLFIIAINYETSFEYIDEVYSMIHNILESYKKDIEIDYLYEVYKLLVDIKGEEKYSKLRNINLPTSIYRKVITYLFDESIRYSNLLKDENKEEYFKSIRTIIGFFSIINELYMKKKVENEVIEEFKIILKEDLGFATRIVDYYINNSNTHTYGRGIYENKVLEYTFFLLEEISPINTKKILTKTKEIIEEHYMHYDRGGPNFWSPTYADYSNHTDTELLEFLSRNHNVNIREKVAKNKLLSKEAIKRLSKDKSDYVRANIVNNPSIDMDLLELMIRDKSIRVICSLCSNPKVALTYLIEKSKSNNEDILIMIAGNPNITNCIVENLLKDGRQKVLVSLANNDSISLKVFEELSELDDIHILMALTRNKNTPSNILEKLTLLKNNLLNEYIVSNINISTSTLIKLISYKSYGLNSKAIYNSNISKEILEELIENENWHIGNLAYLRYKELYDDL